MDDLTDEEVEAWAGVARYLNARDFFTVMFTCNDLYTQLPQKMPRWYFCEELRRSRTAPRTWRRDETRVCPASRYYEYAWLGLEFPNWHSAVLQCVDDSRMKETLRVHGSPLGLIRWISRAPAPSNGSQNQDAAVDTYGHRRVLVNPAWIRWRETVSNDIDALRLLLTLLRLRRETKVGALRVHVTGDIKVLSIVGVDHVSVSAAPGVKISEVFFEHVSSVDMDAAALSSQLDGHCLDVKTFHLTGPNDITQNTPALADVPNVRIHSMRIVNPYTFRNAQSVDLYCVGFVDLNVLSNVGELVLEECTDLQGGAINLTNVKRLVVDECNFVGSGAQLHCPNVQDLEVVASTGVASIHPGQALRNLKMDESLFKIQSQVVQVTNLHVTVRTGRFERHERQLFCAFVDDVWGPFVQSCLKVTFVSTRFMATFHDSSEATFVDPPSAQVALRTYLGVNGDENGDALRLLDRELPHAHSLRVHDVAFQERRVLPPSWPQLASPLQWLRKLELSCAKFSTTRIQGVHSLKLCGCEGSVTICRVHTAEIQGSTGLQAQAEDVEELLVTGNIKLPVVKRVRVCQVSSKASAVIEEVRDVNMLRLSDTVLEQASLESVARYNCEWLKLTRVTLQPSIQLLRVCVRGRSASQRLELLEHERYRAEEEERQQQQRQQRRRQAEEEEEEEEEVEEEEEEDTLPENMDTSQEVEPSSLEEDWNEGQQEDNGSTADSAGSRTAGAGVGAIQPQR